MNKRTLRHHIYEGKYLELQAEAASALASRLPESFANDPRLPDEVMGLAIKAIDDYNPDTDGDFSDFLSAYLEEKLLAFAEELNQQAQASSQSVGS